MPQPSFVHLRLHSEFSIVDGIVRIDDAVARAAADGMGALALTDLANVFGMVDFYKSARKAGLKPIVGCDVWITNEAERDKPHRLLLLVRSRTGYRRLSDLLSRAYLENQHRGRAELRKAWFADGGAEGLIALSGALSGDVGTALAAGNGSAAERLAAAWAALFPDAYYLELQRAGHPQEQGYVDAAVRLAGRLGLPAVATHPVQFLRREDFKAHEARVCIAEGYVLADQRRPRAFTPESYFKTQAEMAKVFADLPEALANSVAIAQRCNLALELGRSRLPEFPTPPGVTLEDHLAAVAERGLAQRLGELYPGRDGARAPGAALSRAARVRDQDHRADGVRRLLPDRRGLHQLGEVERRPGRARPRLGRRLARRLRARDHRPGSAPLRPPVRALPQPRARVDAGLRHRLLPGRPRQGDRVRQAEVRRGVGVADRDLRHDGGEGGGARRRPGDGVAVQPRRRAREADPVPARQADHAAGRARDGAAPEGTRGQRGGHARAARARRGPRGTHPQRRDARGRRADRAGKDHRLLPGLRRARLGGGRVAARHEGRRGGRPGQVRLPRPDNAHHPRLDDPLRAAARPVHAPLARGAPTRRQGHLPRLPGGERRGGVPVRIARHARPPQARAPGPLRGPDRAGGALPAGADGPDPRLHRAQARPAAGRVPRPAPRVDPGADLRRDGVPGAGDADRAGDRRLLARQRRSPPPRDGEEAARGDGDAPRRVRRGGRREPAFHSARRTSSST